MRNITDTFESLKIALQAIKANKARGLLTTLGIIIGIVAVVTTMTAANGLENSFKESISVLGSDVLYVSRTPWVHSGRWFEFRNRQNLTLKEADKLKTQLKRAVAVNPVTDTRRSIKYRSRVIDDVSIVGTTDKHIVVSSGVPDYGRFLNHYDVEYKHFVCVIGSEVKKRLFDTVDPINKKMKIGRYDFRVVGVMEQQGGAGMFGGPNFDMQIYIPITSFMKAFGGRDRDFDFVVKAPSTEVLPDFEYELVGEMRKIRKLKPTDKDDFSINQMSTLVAAYNNVMGVVVMIGLLITGVSLFVGGIGVMNIMFVSVTERTREIGIRKAIGAKRRTILTQFLFESSVICLLGGLVGVIFSFGVTALINSTVMPASISIPIVIIALAISVLVGVFSGIIPAYRASRLNPIEALRYE
ncbi:MAG: ABC transporter permease [Calditrichaceae bacterium]|nr:ABC transporter permease [Calditrichia bacterium]NUQ40730.1 ABC transporter permease [Calditrichaceae bacterium]